MLFYLLSRRRARASCSTRLGYPLDRAAIPDHVDYYLARTCHGSTLSAVVHAWVLARAHRDQALEFLDRGRWPATSRTSRAAPPRKASTWPRMAGGADLLQRCFAGIEPRLDCLHVSPCWPTEPVTSPSWCATRATTSGSPCPGPVCVSTRSRGGQPGACHLRRDDVPAGSGQQLEIPLTG